MSTLIPQDLQLAIDNFESFTSNRVTVAFKTLSSIECWVHVHNNRDGKFSYPLTQPGKTKTGRKKTSRCFTKDELIQQLESMSSFE